MIKDNADITGNKVRPTSRLLSSEEVYTLDIETVRKWYKEYVNPSIEDVIYSFSFGEQLVDWAEGVWLYYHDNRKVFDATGGIGVLNLGHNHPRILKARIGFQERKKMEVHKLLFSPYTAALSRNLAALFNDELQYSFFCNSGAEAVEGAIKTAYKYHNGSRRHILHSDRSYHGKLLGAGSITTSSEVNYKFPGIPDTHAFIYNDIESVRDLVARLKTSDQRSDIYAMIVEPYSVSTLTPCSDEFLRDVRRICDENGIVLIFDEVLSGWHKMGPLFYFFKSGVYPDILTLSKTIGGGKASISAFISKPKIYKAAYGNINHAFLHTTTYNGFGEECITANEAINIIVDEDIAGKTLRIERIMRQWLENLRLKYPERIVYTAGSGSYFGFRVRVLPGTIGRLAGLIPSGMSEDKVFVDKVEAAAFCDFLFRQYNIYTIFGGQKEIYITMAPSAIVDTKDLEQMLAKVADAVGSFSINDIVSFAARRFKKKLF